MPYSKYSNNSDCRTVVVTVAVIMRIVYILCMCEGQIYNHIDVCKNIKIFKKNSQFSKKK